MRFELDAPKDTHCYLEIGNYSCSVYGYDMAHATYRAIYTIIGMFIDDLLGRNSG
jgi:hypothetical protein